MSAPNPAQVVAPGRSIGFITLGVSLHDILTRLKAQPQIYSSIDVTYSSSEPITLPVVVNLPRNGLRLRFDGPDQRLRLIEVVDFSRTRLVYHDEEIYRTSEHSGPFTGVEALGPSFRHIYKLFGPSQPGEYIPPANPAAESNGTYVLSYPGIAFSFPLQHSAWTPGTDSAKATGLLMSSAASPAVSMALFSGHSWPDARRGLFTSEPPNPRSLALGQKGKEVRPAEIELAKIHGEGRVELVRTQAEPFWIILSETTPQDLITEFGPPDAIYKKVDRRSDIHREVARGTRSNSVSPARGEDSSETDYASSHTEDSDNDDERMVMANKEELESAEVFYNYFSHGFDVLISQPTSTSPPSPTAPKLPSRTAQEELPKSAALPVNHLTATKIIFHGNIPGSYTFNRHRRSRWTLDHVPSQSYADPLTSEMKFRDIRGRLEEVFKESYSSEEEKRIQQEPMSVHREVGDSPSSSCELVGGPMEGMNVVGEGGEDGGDGRAKVMGNTQIWPFPGMLFEVLKNGDVSALTVF